jgi:uncharacterized protein (DUF305 family)
MRALSVLALVLLTAACGSTPPAAHETEKVGGPEPSNAVGGGSPTGPVAQDPPFDLAFIDHAIDHHMQAVVLGHEAQRRGVHPELRELGERIAKAQQAEVDHLKALRQEWYAERLAERAEAEQPSPATMPSAGAADASYDRRFLDLMIPHHEQMIAMAADVMARGEHARLQALARHMAESQRDEIAQMERMRASWAGE